MKACKRRFGLWPGVVAMGLAFSIHDAAAQDAGQIIDAAEMAAEVEGQRQGSYGALQRDASVPVGQIQEAWDAADGDAGVYNAAFHPSKVVKIVVRQYMVTTIVFPPWEEIGDIYLGDDFVFVAERTRPNIVVVRASQIGADTSLTAVGESGLVYAFYIRAVGVNAKVVPDLKVRVLANRPRNLPTGPGQEAWPNPAEAEALASRASAPIQPGREGESAGEEESGLKDPDFLEEIKFDPSRLRFDFSMTGNREIAPERVFADGTFTYFDYGDRWGATDLPAIYRVVDGVDTPVNTRTRGSMVIAEATGAFTLRNGRRVVCVRPSEWNPALPTEKAQEALNQRERDK